MQVLLTKNLPLAIPTVIQQLWKCGDCENFEKMF